MKQFALASTLSLLVFATGCRDTASTEGASKTPTVTADAPLTLDYEKYELDNGLDVILHVDRSDPVVAINLAAHVGSGREVTGRTGFAHLFEHLLFLDSENLGYGGLDEMNTRIGGEGTNGFTTHDITQYFQAVPRDAIEKVIWAEADKIGYFLQTVSQNVVDNEKQVVKNEKRQRVDNAPYGHNFYIINRTIYPDTHPYHHTVIGSLADLDAASLSDVRDFYTRWYGPNNVTLTITGDIDKAETKALVTKYFGEIPAGPEVVERDPMPGTLTANRDLMHEDAFATVPQLTLVWPAVEATHPDAPALDILAEYLTSGKKAPFNEVLVDETKVAPNVGAFNYTKELAGEFYLIANPNQGEDIDGLMGPITTAFTRFETNGIPQADLDRIKAGLEVGVYDEIQSALGKSIALGEGNALTGEPDALTRRVARLQAVTPADVTRVYETYLKDKPRLSTSFVPKGELDLALEGANVADVVEETIVEGEGAPVDFDPSARTIDTPTPSSFDRKIEPAFGPGYELPDPDVVQARYENGLNVYLLASDETPLVQFSLRLDAGRVRNTTDAPAVAGMTAAMLEKGTATKTTAELEDAIKDLGSEINVSAGERAVFITGKTLARNFDATMDLVKEMVFQPRWDADEFDTLRRQAAESITQSEGSPNSIARRLVRELRYPDSSPLHHAGATGFGTRDGVEALTLDQLQAFHDANYTLDGAALRIVGNVDQDRIQSAWDDGTLPNTGTVRDAVTVDLTPVDKAGIYFYDVPDAKQSVIQMFRPALAVTDKDFALAEAVNFPLGGIYTSKLNTELRVNKGYTYGIRSGFSGEADGGFFALSSSVRTNVTKESLELIREILASHGPSTTAEELEETKQARIRGQALGNETLSDKLSLLGDVSAYGLAPDYRAQNARDVAAMTLADFQRIASDHIDPDRMVYIIVGDAATQLDRVRELGLPVTKLN